MKKTFQSIAVACYALLALSACKKSDDGPQDTPANSYTNIELGSQNNPKGCFLSLRTGTVYTISDAFYHQANVDLLFWYNRDTGGASSTATWLTSPAGTMSYYGAYHQEEFIFSTKGLNNWQTLNNTEMGNLAITSGQFDAIENIAQLTTAFNSDSRIFGNSLFPKANDILRFKTHDGKIAVMRVNSVTGNANSTAGRIMIDIKAQP